jgi:hypothetical protein
MAVIAMQEGESILAPGRGSPLPCATSCKGQQQRKEQCQAHPIFLHFFPHIPAAQFYAVLRLDVLFPPWLHGWPQPEARCMPGFFTEIIGLMIISK